MVVLTNAKHINCGFKVDTDVAFTFDTLTLTATKRRAASGEILKAYQSNTY